MIHKILASSRFVVIIAVFGSFLASLSLLIYGGIQSVSMVITLLQGEMAAKGAKAVSVAFIELIDLFLLGTVFFIISMGLYELFIDDRIELPAWLVVRNLDDLKGKLISGVIVIMGVYFLGALVEWDGQTDLARLSLSIAVMIAALTLFQFVNARKTDH